MTLLQLETANKRQWWIHQLVSFRGRAVPSALLPPRLSILFWTQARLQLTSCSPCSQPGGTKRHRCANEADRSLLQSGCGWWRTGCQEGGLGVQLWLTLFEHLMEGPSRQRTNEPRDFYGAPKDLLLFQFEGSVRTCWQSETYSPRSDSVTDFLSHGPPDQVRGFQRRAASEQKGD